MFDHFLLIIVKIDTSLLSSLIFMLAEEKNIFDLMNHTLIFDNFSIGLFSVLVCYRHLKKAVCKWYDH